ncbi:Rne/Rng family ribonuclease [Acidiphilium sp. PA]|uniref:ribonuclease E/G n=1 Tax=Acidiphilium sp. PA TaxID=2871705 RepID=UPI002244C2FD|nr:ribonuclease E/G [Acidiphilium sp. PA]MCW8306427.1 Rne/Rng family ribonuclease [Acidiphilium sp. PA]
MTKTMLIDASHAEETRVVVLDNNRLDDFDIETADKKQIKGNIYLAKVIRVEPSLQAAFVEYGGNRHGFLAFAEIHPDYYQIPVADRQKLLAMEAEEARRRSEAEDAEDARAGAPRAQALEAGRAGVIAEIPIGDAPPAMIDAATADDAPDPGEGEGDRIEDHAEPAHVSGAAAAIEAELASNGPPPEDGEVTPAAPPEQVGGGDDGADEARERRRMRALRSYKIQEVIHRRQIILVQVVKEERGSKGAALTTYISLAGRFSVLMPNSPNGGGVSRKITSVADRRRLKEVMAELDIPDGMGMIVRTAGAARPKPEIKRDCEYLLRLWDDIREKTLASIAPALVYEEATLIKRTIRDVYTRDVDTLLIEGEEGYRTAREFMRMLMPTAVKKVVQWNDRQPLYAKYQVEQMLDQMFQPTVQLRSGGYLVINQTEALVAIDVNSGRATRERNIEDTALRTNMEAAEEVARQLRLRDLAGLIVIDFIDMEVRRNNAMVERKLKDALKNDRARIQVGSISHFGLMEMSRQRLRPSISETMLIPCPHCAGVGHIRSTASTALAVLRAIEDEAARQAAEIVVHLAPEVALYIFNHKRAQLAATETRFDMVVRFAADGLVPAEFKVETLRTQAVRPVEAPVMRPADPVVSARDDEEDAADEGDEETMREPVAGHGGPAGDAKTADEAERGRRRRRRRRRGGRRDEAAPAPGAEQPDVPELPDEFAARLGQPVAPRAEPVGEADGVAVTGDEDRAVAASVPEAVVPETGIAAAGAMVAEGSADAPAGPEPVLADAAPVAEKPKRRPPRRRRASGEGEAAAAPAPVLPVFTDIADIFEAAEQAEARVVKPRRAPRAAAKTVVQESLIAAAPEARSDQGSDPGPEPTPAPAPAPVREPEPVPMPAPEPVHEPEPAPEPVKAAVVKPVLVDAVEPQAAPKRGWWKRG